MVDEGIEEAAGACAVEALLEVCVDGIMIWLKVESQRKRS
jgi:hypothetical protein